MHPPGGASYAPTPRRNSARVRDFLATKGRSRAELSSTYAPTWVRQVHPPSMIKKPSLGSSVSHPRAPGSFVQTERRAHEAWASLISKSPTAAMVMHHLVARMGHQNAVVIGQKTLAKLIGCHPDTVKRAVADLVEDRWVQVVQVGGRGTVNAYVVNDTIAWGQKRDQRAALSVFSAQVVADAEDQSPATLEARELRRLPLIYPPEEALPAGPGEPGAQMLLDGMEPVIEGAPRQMDIEDFE